MGGQWPNWGTILCILLIWYNNHLKMFWLKSFCFCSCVLCAVSGGTAQEQIGSSCFSRPIKLRVNLAPHMMEVRATMEKNFASRELFAEEHGGNYYIKRIITFLISARTGVRRKASQGRGKYHRELAHADLIPRNAYSVIQIRTKRHEQPFSLQLCFVLLNGRWPTKSLFWTGCIWKLVVFWGGASE